MILVYMKMACQDCNVLASHQIYIVILEANASHTRMKPIEKG